MEPTARWVQLVRLASLAVAALFLILGLLRFVRFSAPALFPLVAVALPITAIALVVALLTWSPKLAAAGLVVVAATWLLSLPGEVIPRTGCSLDDGLILYSHNVSWEHGEPVAVAQQINTLAPEIVLLQEADAEFLATLQRELDDPYLYVTASTSDQTLSLAVLSRWPLSDVVDTWPLTTDHNPLLVVTIERPDGPLRIANLHLSAPRSSDLINRQEQEWEVLQPLHDDVQIFAGDFNSTSAHIRYRNFVKTVGRDAHDLAGCGRGATWSPQRSGPAILALDHAVVNEGIQVLGHQLLDYAGSDHRAIAFSVDIAKR